MRSGNLGKTSDDGLGLAVEQARLGIERDRLVKTRGLELHKPVAEFRG